MNAVLARCVPCVLGFIVIFITACFIDVEIVTAAVSSCTSSVAPTSIDANTSGDFSLSTTNGDESNSVVWIKITRPSSNFTIDSGGVSDSYTDTSTSIGPGGFTTTTFSATSGSANASSANWTVQVSDEAEGADPTTCTGDLGTSIVNGTDAISISSLTLSEVTTTSVKISWTTSVAANSLVEYGTTSSYGSAKSDSTLSTSHSLTIDSLSADTSYHYRISSGDGSNTAIISDNTFTTAVSSTSTTTSTTVVVNTTTTTTTTVASDNTKPTVRVTTDFSKPYDKAPKIIGRAFDNKSIVRIDYSIDNGVNWQPVDTASLSKASVSFDFTPAYLDDDTYKIKVRAVDGGGNIGLSAAYLLTIDRLPPSVGSVFFSVGPQPLRPLGNGKIYGLQGMDQKITLSSIGGATSIDIISGNKMFSLVKNIDTGLWSGVLGFESPGTYKMVARSVDGGGAKVERSIGAIEILEKGKITNGISSDKTSASVSVYYFDYITNRFVLWDGSAYGQHNPQSTNSEGNYMFYLPPGKFFLEVKAPGYRNLKSNIFETYESMPLVSNFKLEKKLIFFDFTQTEVKINPNFTDALGSENNRLIGQQLPDVELFDGDRSLQASSLRGKRVLISVLNSWNPLSYAQMSILNEVASESEIEVGAIFPQQTASRINMLKQRGAYKFPMLADPDGLLVEPLNILQLPMNIYVSRNGTIESVTYGVLNSYEIEKKLLD